MVAGHAATPVPAGEPAPLIVAGDPILGLAEVAPGSTTLYAVGGNAVYRSDGGGAWRRAGPPPPPGRLVASEDGALLLAGSRPPCARGGDQPPLHRFVGGGWREVAGVAGAIPLAAWADADLALAADCAGLLLGTDAGAAWRPVAAPGPGFEVTDFAPTTGTASGRSGLLVGVSEGGAGQVWLFDLADPDRPAAGPALTNFWGAGVAAGRGARFAIGTARGVLLSEDAGATWRLSRSGLEDATVSVDPARGPIPDEESARGFGVGAVAIDPTDPDRLFAGTVRGLYESIDGGASWQRLAGVDGRVRAIVLPADGGRLFAATDDGVVVVPRSAR